MFNIAVMYNRSEGVALDRDELYFWYYLSSMGVLPKEQAESAKKACEILSTKIAPAKLTEIHERARSWAESHPKIHL